MSASFNKKYVIGIDFGSDSCRALLVCADDGKEIDSEVFYYPRWRKGLFCDPQRSSYRQHPLDYIESLTETVSAITRRAEAHVRESIVALGIDTTGSTPCFVDHNAVPLAMREEFADNPNAMFVLWKDHTAIAEAAEITAAAKKSSVDYTKFIGGIYSSEWILAKALNILRSDSLVRDAAYTIIEHCDWIPALLTGVDNAANIMRSRCAAGHKAMWNAQFGGLPPEDFFLSIDSLLGGLRDTFGAHTYTADTSAGTITPQWASKLGLPDNTVVASGAFDCHMGAVGGRIEPGALVKVMGTSTCDVVVSDLLGTDPVEGICGQVDGSVIPGMTGFEAGQSAYGDVFAWFKRLISYTLDLVEDLTPDAREAIDNSILYSLENDAKDINDGTILALDWFNGRRTPFANASLPGALSGLSLASGAPALYRALLEGTAFGAKAVADRFIDAGIPVDYIIAMGGICKKSPLAMRIVADVTGLPVKVCASDQTVALGASIFAACAAGLYPSVQAAQAHMACDFQTVYQPDSTQTERYRRSYSLYSKLGGFIESSPEFWRC